MEIRQSFFLEKLLKKKRNFERRCNKKRSADDYNKGKMSKQMKDWLLYKVTRQVVQKIEREKYLVALEGVK